MNEYLNLVEFIQYLNLNMVLNNQIIEIGYFDLENRDKLWDEFILDVKDNDYSEDELLNIFAETVETADQYFIVPDSEIEYWDDYTDYPLYYSVELDIYLVGITLGEDWEYFNTTYPRPDYMK